MSSQASASIYFLFFTKLFHSEQTDGIEFTTISFEASSVEDRMEEREGWCILGSVSVMDISYIWPQ